VAAKQAERIVVTASEEKIESVLHEWIPASELCVVRAASKTILEKRLLQWFFNSQRA
jgi:hypothetical protein